MLPRSLSDKTARRYTAAQDAYLAWLYRHDHRFPAPESVAAAYLKHVRATRGESVVSLHLAAIRNFYGAAGLVLDLKTDALQPVTRDAWDAWDHARAQRRTRRRLPLIIGKTSL